ncbi:MAG: DUF971 domain-containing protein [Chlamydiae bacterium]|nr:DUF971 domain-containing protein [Chlamydiota bacterium]
MKEILLEMRQIGATTIELTYSDGVIKKLHLETVQKNCGCTRCKGGQAVAHPGVSVSKVSTVGRFGLKFYFLKGCQQGIYGHKQLRDIPCDF